MHPEDLSLVGGFQKNHHEYLRRGGRENERKVSKSSRDRKLSDNGEKKTMKEKVLQKNMIVKKKKGSGEDNIFK